jgi:hypothetical protein
MSQYKRLAPLAMLLVMCGIGFFSLNALARPTVDVPPLAVRDCATANAAIKVVVLPNNYHSDQQYTMQLTQAAKDAGAILAADDDMTIVINGQPITKTKYATGNVWSSPQISGTKQIAVSTSTGPDSLWMLWATTGAATRFHPVALGNPAFESRVETYEEEFFVIGSAVHGCWFGAYNTASPAPISYRVFVNDEPTPRVDKVRPASQEYTQTLDLMSWDIQGLKPGDHIKIVVSTMDSPSQDRQDYLYMGTQISGAISTVWPIDDTDGDGIPDQYEGNTDTDGDGAPNSNDLDSDGDGKTDATECPALPCRDTDNDGVPDFLDPNDGTPGDPIIPICSMSLAHSFPAVVDTMLWVDMSAFGDCGQVGFFSHPTGEKRAILISDGQHVLQPQTEDVCFDWDDTRTLCILDKGYHQFRLHLIPNSAGKFPMRAFLSLNPEAFTYVSIVVDVWGNRVMLPFVIR